MKGETALDDISGCCHLGRKDLPRDSCGNRPTRIHSWYRTGTFPGSAELNMYLDVIRICNVPDNAVFRRTGSDLQSRFKV